MKRYGTALTCAVLLAVGSVALYAESTALSIEPSQMKDGETKSFTDNGRTITVQRDGNRTNIRIEGADKTEKLTITSEGNRIRIGRIDSDSARAWVIDPDRRRIVVDGTRLPDLDLPKFRMLPPTGKATSWFVCPKDKTIVRVPEEKADETFKCPVDGTTLEKRKGHGFRFFFDENVLDATPL